MKQLIGKEYGCLSIFTKTLNGYKKRLISDVVFGLSPIDLTKDGLAIQYTEKGIREQEFVDKHIICNSCELPDIEPNERIKRPIGYMQWEKIFDNYLIKNQVEVLIDGRNSKTTFYANNKEKLEALRGGKKNTYFFGEHDEVKLPEEINEEELLEGSTTKITINSYERNIEARQKCLEEHGYSCMACGLNLEDKYGEVAKNFIHVHHKVPLNKIGKEYVVDPINDLVPLCPNCHSIAHLNDPPYSIEKIIEFIGKNDG